MNVLILAALGGVGALFYFAAAGATESFSQQATALENSVSDAIAPLTSDWNRFDDLFRTAEATYGVDWTWLKAFCLNESDLGRAVSVARGLSDPTDVDGSKSSDGKSWGLLQVTLKTAKGLDSQATEEKLNDPSYSVNLGAKYISQLKKMFRTDDPRYVEWVVKSYNQGPGNTKNEIDETGGGYADAYWSRWQRNLTRVEENLT